MFSSYFCFILLFYRFFFCFVHDCCHDFCVIIFIEQKLEKETQNRKKTTTITFFNYIKESAHQG
jgi:hypothetical protein